MTTQDEKVQIADATQRARAGRFIYPWGDVVGRPARANRNTSEPTRLRCRF